MPTPTLVVAATGSGCGKTTVVAGLLAALRRRGLVVQPFKCGPDYIDPGYHTRAAGRTCRNLDSWMLDDTQVAACFTRACRGADLAVVEGVMGLYDGSSFTEERASAAQIAKLLGAPVLLILDISGSARSAAAMAHGFATLDPQLHVGACVLNFAGSEGHARGCADAIAQLAKLPTHGWLPRAPDLAIPERHLGLALAGEQADLDGRLSRLADAIEPRFDLDAIVALATRSAGFQPAAPDSASPPAPSNLAGTEARRHVRSACSTVAHSAGQQSLPATPDTANSPASALSGLRSPVSDSSTFPVPSSPFRVSGPPSPVSGLPSPLLAVAHDEAFCFHYPDNLDLLKVAGAQLAFFRPAHGERLPAGATGVYLGGGYPELHAAALSANQGFFDDLHALHARGAPIYAECGGFMVLTEALFDLEGRRWPMAGLVPDTVRMTPDLVALGYRHATAACNHLLADAGTTLRGHEFHHSRWEPAVPAAANAWQLRGTDPAAPATADGHAYDNLLASYLHIHFGQAPAIAARFVARLREAARQLVGPVSDWTPGSETSSLTTALQEPNEPVTDRSYSPPTPTATLPMKTHAATVFRRPPERLNCAQAVLDAYQAVTGRHVASLAEFKAFGGGRAPGGECGALHAACQCAPESAEALCAAFAARTGTTLCKELDAFSCADCVGLSAELLSLATRAGGPSTAR